MQKYASVDFSICRPLECREKNGSCSAVLACKKKVLEQEEPDESPILLSMTLCVGCGKCAAACVHKAIRIESSG